MKLLFVGESFYGSSARSLFDAVVEHQDVEAEAVSPDLFLPIHKARMLRAANRILAPYAIAELKREIERACADFQPDVIMVVKGWHFDAEFVRSLQRRFAPVVNIFPDASPHAHGERLKEAVGVYDLVISRNRQHHDLWTSVYGYSNPHAHVTHAYCRRIHLRTAPPEADPPYDVILVASGRGEYEALVKQLIARLAGRGVSIALAGPAWAGRGLEGPGVHLVGAKPGAAYADWLRKGRIVVAPVQTILHANGVRQPGDEVSGRTFQCASAHTFFIHRRTDEVSRYYDEESEVPLYDDALDLADKIEFYLPQDALRRKMAAAAHARAVPAYSYDARAGQILRLIRTMVMGAAHGPETMARPSSLVTEVRSGGPI